MIKRQIFALRFIPFSNFFNNDLFNMKERFSMKASKNKFRFFAASVGITAPLWFMSNVAHAEDFTDPSVNSYWSESWTDSSGNYNSPATNTTVSGDALNAPIPTDADPALPDYDVVNYVR